MAVWKTEEAAEYAKGLQEVRHMVEHILVTHTISGGIIATILMILAFIGMAMGTTNRKKEQ